MDNAEVGNPIKVVTELIGVFQYLVSRLARSEPRKAFHEMNMDLMAAVYGELGRHYEKNAPNPLQQVLDEQLRNDPSRDAQKDATEKTDDGSALNDAWAKWEEMRSLYGDKSFLDFNKADERMYAAVGEAASISEALKDNIILSYLRLCYAGPLSQRAKRAIVFSAGDSTKRAIGKKIVDQMPPGALNAEHSAGNNANWHKAVFLATAKEVPELIDAVINSMELNEVFVDSISKAARRAPGFTVLDENASEPDYLRAMCAQLAWIKELLLSIMPMTLRDQLTRDQEDILARIRDLKRKIMSITQDREIDEWLDLGEIGDTVNSLPTDKLATDIDEIATLRDMQFKMPGVKESIVQDYADTLAMYNQRLYKYAVIGCGGILENMLKEFLYRREKDVKRIVEDPKKREQIMKASPFNSYTKPDNIASYSLLHLNLVVDMIIHDTHPEYFQIFEMIRKARNKVHGGAVKKYVADFAVTTIKCCIDLINETPITESGD